MRSLSSVAVLGRGVVRRGAGVRASDLAGPGRLQCSPGPSPNDPNGPRIWQNGRWVVLPPRGAPAMQTQPNPQRWGGTIGGRWSGGAQAPGGWSAYRRPHRGASLPAYWMSGSFHIPDYLSFGLAAPPYGYSWVRYYDDAVLVDDSGRVWDSVSGIAWAGASASADAGYARRAEPGLCAQRRDHPGRPKRILRRAGLFGSDSVYPGGVCTAGGGGAAGGVRPEPVPAGLPGRELWSYYGASGYSGGGYYGGGSTTTITFQSAPIVTTTTTEEIVEDEVTTTYVSTPRRIVRRAPVRHYRPRRHVCGCGCCR